MGNFNQEYPRRGWRASDKRLIRHPKTVERVKSAFRNTDMDIRMWFVSSQEAVKFREIGLVNEQWLWHNMPETVNEIQETGGFNPNGINIMYTNNTGAEWRPMSPWIMAHRMAHALYSGRSNSNLKQTREVFEALERRVAWTMQEVLRAYNVELRSNPNVYVFRYKGSNKIQGLSRFDLDSKSETMLKKFFAAIGTFRSARQNTIRTALEFVFECFAQYMLAGAVTFNAAPPQFVTRHDWGRPQSRRLDDPNEEINDMVQGMADEMNQEFQRALAYACGYVLVM